MTFLASAKGNEISTCLRTEALVEFKSQTTDQFSLNTHIQEHIIPLHIHIFCIGLTSLLMCVPLD